MIPTPVFTPIKLGSRLLIYKKTLTFFGHMDHNPQRGGMCSILVNYLDQSRHIYNHMNQLLPELWAQKPTTTTIMITGIP